MQTHKAPTVNCVGRVRAEYLDMPGLNLTKAQVRRLWGIDAATCDAALQTLTRSGFLERTANGLYVRVNRRV